MRRVLLLSSRILIALLLLLSMVGFALYWWVNTEKFQIAGEIIPRVATEEKVVALTFDDGPTEYADEILAILKEKEVTATFYLIGNQIEENLEEAQKIVEAGHEIGNHSYSHSRLIFKSAAFIAREVESTNQLIRGIGYEGEITFRPPNGKKLVALPRYLDRHNMKTITWDVEPLKALESDSSANELVQYVGDSTRSGSIILIHPWYGESNPSRDAIPAIIDVLHAEGYTFVTVGELLILAPPD